MSLYESIPRLGYAETATAVAACVRAKRSPMIMGAPGVGKTALAAIIAEAFKRPLVTCILSNVDPTDIAGLPMLDSKDKVQLHPFPSFREAIENPRTLFMDEFTAMRRSVEAPALRLMLERVAGGRPLHPDSVIIGACNAPEHAPGGIELSAAMLNRLIWLRYEPSFKDVSGYFDACATSKEGVRVEPANVEAARKGVQSIVTVDYAASFQLECLDFAATSKSMPDLIQLEPPPDAVTNGMPWASPRAWEAGLAAYSALGREATSGKADMIGYAILAGAVGPFSAAAYLGIRDLRVKLPTVQEIIDDPEKAKLPTRELSVAVLGVITRVASQDVGAAFLYLARTSPEIAAAAYRGCCKYSSMIQKSKHGAKKALDAYSKLSRSIGDAL
jgi:MoxR-like ATPase